MKNNTVEMVIEYTVQDFYVDWDESLFDVKLRGYKMMNVMFYEFESFIREFDPKLYKYLRRFKQLDDKIAEALDIGFDFSPMLAAFLKEMIEYGLLRPVHE